MAEVIVKLKVMPEDTETDIDELLKECNKAAEKEGAKIHQHEVEPIAFGLKALIIILTIEENKGTSNLEKAIEDLTKVSTLEVLDVRRAIG